MEEGTQGPEEGRRPSSDQGGRARVDLQEAGAASVWSVWAPAGPGEGPECALGGQLPGEEAAGTCARKCSTH